MEKKSKSHVVSIYKDLTMDPAIPSAKKCWSTRHIQMYHCDICGHIPFKKIKWIEQEGKLILYCPFEEEKKNKFY